MVLPYSSTFLHCCMKNIEQRSFKQILNSLDAHGKERPGISHTTFNADFEFLSVKVFSKGKSLLLFFHFQNGPNLPNKTKKCWCHIMVELPIRSKPRRICTIQELLLWFPFKYVNTVVIILTDNLACYRITRKRISRRKSQGWVRHGHASWRFFFFFNWVYWGGKTHPDCGWHHPLGLGSGLYRVERWAEWYVCTN